MTLGVTKNMDILNFKIKIVRRLMHALLYFTSPSNRYVIKCSQFLDVLIVRSQLDIMKKSRKRDFNYKRIHSTAVRYHSGRKESLKEVS